VGSEPAEAHLFWYVAVVLRFDLRAFYSCTDGTRSKLGKILQDANTVESYNIEEKGFIVCMIAKVCPISSIPWDCT
jgi:hypothetical protein